MQANDNLPGQTWGSELDVTTVGTLGVDDLAKRRGYRFWRDDVPAVLGAVVSIFATGLLAIFIQRLLS